jgi:adenosylcobinamide kinase/adenosylcobinamide-phosphate guanylyltransferase
MRILVTGGVRSGKSRHAEMLLSSAESVTYVAPGPTVEDDPDPDWAARLAAHRLRRPASWTTIESHDLATVLAGQEAVMVDCLGTWLTAVIDAEALWDASTDDAVEAITGHLGEITRALHGRTADTVLVTNEVGLGVVPAHRSGRLFRDMLGLANQRIAEFCDEVHLVIAGRVLKL